MPNSILIISKNTRLGAELVKQFSSTSKDYQIFSMFPAEDFDVSNIDIVNVKLILLVDSPQLYDPIAKYLAQRSNGNSIPIICGNNMTCFCELSLRNFLIEAALTEPLSPLVGSAFP